MYMYIYIYIYIYIYREREREREMYGIKEHPGGPPRPNKSQACHRKPQGSHPTNPPRSNKEAQHLVQAPAICVYLALPPAPPIPPSGSGLEPIRISDRLYQTTHEPMYSAKLSMNPK